MSLLAYERRTELAESTDLLCRGEDSTDFSISSNKGGVQRPLISILLLTYNQENFVTSAIESCLSQTYSPLEIIVSDDCSPDGTFEVARKLCDTYGGPHMVKLNRNPKNLGIAGNLNAARRIASGDWLVLAAGDDVSIPERTETLYSSIANGVDQVPLLFSSNRYVDANGLILEGSSESLMSWSGDLVAWCRELGPLHAGATYIVRRDLLDCFPDIRSDVVNEDIVVTFRSLLLGGWRFIPTPLVWYRLHGANASGRQPPERKRDKVIQFKISRALRRSAVARQLLLDTSIAYRRRLITGPQRDALKRVLRARWFDAFLDVRFYMIDRNQNAAKRSFRRFRRLFSILQLTGGWRRVVLHTVRWTAPGLALDATCRRTIRRGQSSR